MKTGETAGRLACRGCLPSCKNYSICDGRPWRLVKTEDKKATLADIEKYKRSVKL